MNLDIVLDDALRDWQGAAAVACADVDAGFVLGASARGEAAREAATNAAECAAQICATPSFSPEAPTGVRERSSEALVVSSKWIHAFARVSHRPELVVVGVAQADANVALLLDWVKRVACGLEATR
jgi:hypothetical protein